MASKTPNLDLLKKDPVADGNDTFNIQTMLNENWDKIDAAVGEVREELKEVHVPSATLTEPGIVQLSSATNSSSEALAATPKAVKSAYDAAVAAQATANAANSAAAAAQNTANSANSAAAAAQNSANTANNAIGSLTSLLTGAKTNTVAAINELFTNVSDGKNAIASAITGKGVPASGGDTFVDLAGKIGAIQTKTYGIIDINRPGNRHEWVPSGTIRITPLCQFPAGTNMFTFRVSGSTPGYFGPSYRYNDDSGYGDVYVVLRNIGGSSHIKLVNPNNYRAYRYKLISLSFEYASNSVLWVVNSEGSTEPITFFSDTFGVNEGGVDLSAPTELCLYNHVSYRDGSPSIYTGIVGRVYYA